ncbi:hypothetical protein [Sphingomonas cavernae]|uniref:hypothetical protein n=1 Tax=Sphingomonas cavernae TaxID=2320861 RepID=UPI0011C38F84|nr:hypothetical protein [Sphingomonas cavernae]
MLLIPNASNLKKRQNSAVVEEQRSCNLTFRSKLLWGQSYLAFLPAMARLPYLEVLLRKFRAQAIRFSQSRNALNSQTWRRKRVATAWRDRIYAASLAKEISSSPCKVISTECRIGVFHAAPAPPRFD